MLTQKLPPVTLMGAVAVEGVQNFTVGSLSSLLDHNVMGYEPLPWWPLTQPDPTVRDAKAQAEDVVAKKEGDRDSDESDKELDLRRFYNKDVTQQAGGGSSSSESEDSEEEDDEEEDENDDEDDEESEDSEGDGSDEEDSSESEAVSIVSVASARPLAALGTQLSKQSPARSSPPSASVGSPAAATNPVLHTMAMAPMRRVAKKAPAVEGVGVVDNLLDSPVRDSLSSSKAKAPSESMLLSFPNDSLPVVSQQSLLSSSPLSGQMDARNSIDQLFAHNSAASMSLQAASSAISSMNLNESSAHSDPLLLPFNVDSSKLLMPAAISPVTQGSGSYNLMQGMPQQHQSLHLQPPPVASTGPPSLQEGERLSSSRLVLKPELTGGLGLSMCYRFTPPGVLIPGAHSMLAVLKNHSDHAIRSYTSNMHM